MNENRAIPKRHAPSIDTWDVLIAGGGIAGISAALSARRAGARHVLLMEREFTLGGLATLGLITFYLPLCDGMGRQVSYGIAEELLRLSVRYGAEEPVPACWAAGGSCEKRRAERYRCRFNAALFAALAEQLLLDEGVQILYGAAIGDAHMHSGRLCAVEAQTKSGRQAYAAHAFVDATGDADLCCLAGEETSLFAQGNVLAAWYYDAACGQMRLHTIGAADIPDSEKAPDDVHDGRMRYGGLDAWELSRMMTESRQTAVRDFLKQGDLSVCHALATLPTIPQVRMTRRLDAPQRMTLNMDGAWHAESVGIISNWKKAGPVYEVPFGALCARADNLYAAGRCIAAEDDMWDVTRVIPCCAVTGEAAGAAAALGRSAGAVQRELQRRGIPLHIRDLPK